MSLYGAHVVMACRDIAKGNMAAEKIRDIRKVIDVVHHNYLFAQLHVHPSKLFLYQFDFELPICQLVYFLDTNSTAHSYAT